MKYNKQIELLNEMNGESIEKRNNKIKENMYLVYNRTNTKFKNAFVDESDLISVGTIGLIKAVDTYYMSKYNDFSKYAINCIDREVIIYLKRQMNSIKNTKNNIIPDNYNFVEDIENKEIYNIIRNQIKSLPDMDKQITMMYYGFYNRLYSEDEISKKLKISKSYITAMINTITIKIGENLKNLGLIELRKTKENKEYVIK